MITPSRAIESELSRLPGQPDEAIDLAEAALALAALDRPSATRDRYRDYLGRMASELPPCRGDDPEDCVAAMNEVIVGRHRFVGDSRDYDDLDNANLMRVIDRRKGLPVTLGILYLHLGRTRGWSMCGLGFPAQFLVRLQTADGRRAIIDPFDGGRRLDAAGMRTLLKALSGNGAELEPAHYAPVSNRDILLRLQNNIKLRLLRGGAMDKALSTVRAMLLFAPDHVPLWREAGLMQLRLGDLRSAVISLEQFVARTTNPQARHRTSLLLQELRGRLH